jgi:hypothetical protein
MLMDGVLCASGILGCIGSTLPGDVCYGSAQSFFTNALITTPVTLDWQTAFGRANASNSLSPNPDNPHNLDGNGFETTPWTTMIDGVKVGVTVGSDFTAANPALGRFLARVNNEEFVWDPNLNRWVVPESSHDPGIFTSFTYAGHFDAPGAPAGIPQTGDGAHLLEMFNGNNGPFGTGSYVINFDKGISAAGLLVSVRGSGTNTDFEATMTAFDKNGEFLATYVVNTAGLGGQCDSLFGVVGVAGSPPTPCNDAPFIGVRAPGNIDSPQIFSIVISATTGVGNLDSVLLDSLQFEVAAPEPAVVFLCGAGLVLISVLRRKQRAAGGSKP